MSHSFTPEAGKQWRGVLEVYNMIIAALKIKKSISMQCYHILHSIIIKSTQTVSILFRPLLKPAYTLGAIALYVMDYHTSCEHTTVTRYSSWHQLCHKDLTSSEHVSFSFCPLQ